MSSGKRKKRKSRSSPIAAVLNHNTLKQMAGPVYFERGERYFNSRLVKGLVEFEDEDRITAWVRGTKKYDVNLRIEYSGLSHSCTCPLGQNGEFCKHCVAVGLEWLDQHDEYAKKGQKSKKVKVNFGDIRDYLSAQEKQSLVEIILDQAIKDDRLRQQLLTRTARASAKGLDLDTFRAAIDYALEIDGFVDYRSTYDYACGINDTIDSIEDLLREGYASEVIELAEYALAAVEGAISYFDDSEGHIGSILQKLQEIHLEACKKAKPDPEELARRLFYWELNSEWEVFYGAAETYSRVLGKKGLALYRRLMETEWEHLLQLAPGSDDSERWGRRFRITSMMESLTRQSGDIEKLVKIKSRDLSSTYSFLNIAEIYREARKYKQALEWAERGIRSFPDRPDHRLQEFLANEYHRAKRHEDAMNQIWAIFAALPGFDQYKLLKTHADKIGEWSAWREKALSLIRQKMGKVRAGKSRDHWFRFPWQDNSELVKIFLWEKNVDAAWREAKQGGCSDNLWYQLAQKLEKDYPEEAAQIYQHLIEPALKQKNNRAYKEAVKLLKQIHSLMNGLGKKEEFFKYLESVKASHKSKRNFMKFLDKAKFS